MRDLQARVIYVGKALSLRNRVPNYFHASSLLPEHIQAMVERIYDFEVLTTANEKEALVLENTLIKRYRPRFNIRLRDDKNYLYIKLPLKEDFPRIYMVRRPGTDGSRYWGPYTNALALRNTLKTVRRVVPYRTCTDHEFALHRPCFYYHLKLCTAPCAGFQSREEYHGQLAQIALFLDGKSDQLVKQLRQQMLGASQTLEYESAARYRDRLEAIETMAQRQKMQALGKLDQAVTYRVAALAIRHQIGTATAGDVQPLAGLRRQLGHDRFRAATLASGLDEQSAANLVQMLDRHEGLATGN